MLLCNYVGEKKAPDLSKLALKEWRRVKSERAGEGGLLPPPVGGDFPTGPPPRDDRVACGGLVGSADLPSPQSARHWECRAQRTCPLTPGDPDCPRVINRPMETLLSAESHHGLGRKRCLNSKAWKSLVLSSDTLSSTWGHWECEILRPKEEWDGVYNWGADLPERLGN